MIQVLDPTAEPSAPIDPYDLRFDPGPGSVLGLVSNAFTDAAAVLGDVRDRMTSIAPGLEFASFAKPNIRASSFPLGDEQLAEITSRCDAVLTAYGHCGSCTSGTVRDAVAIARLGRPVVALVTEKFADEARFVARAAGMPDVPLLVVPHPVAGRDRGFQRELAAEIAGPILGALAGSAAPA